MKPIENNKPFLVIKLGGNALIAEDSLTSFASAINVLIKDGFKIVITHGGGPQISAAFEKAGLSNEFLGGFRVTSSQGAQIVKNVLCVEMQNQVLQILHDSGIQATGICGDNGIFECQKRDYLVTGEIADLGFVGEITKVNINEIENILKLSHVPVVSAVGYDKENQVFNINADTGAAFLAASLHADYLVLLTDVDGVYANWPDANSLLSEISKLDLNELISSVDKGMAPKLEAASSALTHGVPKVAILNGSTGEAVLNYFMNHQKVGTTAS